MQDCFGQHGWKEFHRNRKNILDEFDKILEQTSNRPVRAAHGDGVEAFIRKWLSEFLPKKYGVTSGYIIPNLYDEPSTIYHFDIIIYHHLDAPVLWTEGNEDKSEQGKHRAIPAQYVAAVYEVKSTLTAKNVRDALSKLNQIQSFKDQLNCYYSSGAIFIDLKESENRSGQIVKELHKGHQVFGFRGGMVLRYERDDSCTGQVSFFKNDKTDSTSNGQIIPLAKRIDELNIYQTEDGSVKIAENGGGVTLVKTSATNWSVSKLYSVNYNEEGVSLALSWSRSNFSNFCVDFLSALEGSAYNDQNRPSFGMIFDRLRLELAPLQPSQPRPEYPYLTISLHAGGSNGGKIIVSNEDDADTFEFWVEVENEGEVEALISHDMFQHSIILPVKEKTKTPIKYVSMRDDKSRSLQDILASEGLEFPFRLVYKVSLEGKEELYAVERTVKILGSNISLL